MATDHPGQTEVHDLDVAQRRAAGQQDVLRLTADVLVLHRIHNMCEVNSLKALPHHTE